MKVTLNRAVKLRNQLEAKITPSRSEGLIRTNESLAETEARYNTSKEEALSDLNTALDYISALYSFRALISDKNQEVGINQVLNQTACVEKMISILKKSNTSLNGYGQMEYLEDLKEKQQYELNKSKIEEKAFVSRNENIAFKEVEDKIEQLTSLAKKDLDKLVDKRQSLNHQTIIEIPVEIVDALKKADII